MGNPATNRQAKGLSSFYLRQLRTEVLQSYDSGEAVRSLAQIFELPSRVAKGDELRNLISDVCLQLPPLLNLLADGMESGTHRLHDNLNDLEECLSVRFEVNWDDDRLDLPKKFIRRHDVELDQEALMTAYEAGKLPSCIRVIKPVMVEGGEA